MSSIKNLLESNNMAIRHLELRREVLERSKQNLFWIENNLINDLDRCYFLVYREGPICLIVEDTKASFNEFVMYLSFNGKLIFDIGISDSFLEECKEMMLEKASFLCDVVNLLKIDARISFNFVKNNLEICESGRTTKDDILERYNLKFDKEFNLTIEISEHSKEMKELAEKLKKIYPSISISYTKSLNYITHQRNISWRLEEQLEKYQASFPNI
jgi:hypothetical protein